MTHQSPTEAPVEAWNRLKGGMDRYGMESDTIDELDDYFAHLTSASPTPEQRTVPESVVEDFSGRIPIDGTVCIPAALYTKVEAALSAHPQAPDASPVQSGLVSALADPHAVHVNLLRGSIARPSVRQIIHIYGEDVLRAALNQSASQSPPEQAAQNEALREGEAIAILRQMMEWGGARGSYDARLYLDAKERAEKLLATPPAPVEASSSALGPGRRGQNSRRATASPAPEDNPSRGEGVS